MDEKKVCPDCNGTGVVVQNAGMCGGCEKCGNREETEVACHCQGGNDEDEDNLRDR